MTDIVDFVTIENNELEIQNEAFNLKDLINRFTAKYYIKSAYENKYLDTQIHGVVHEALLGDHRSISMISEQDMLHCRI